MATRKTTPRSHHYNVYVIELSDRVWNVLRFREANPGYELGIALRERGFGVWQA